MSKYFLKNGIYFNGELYTQGQVVELKDEDAADYVKRGSIRPYVEGEEESSPATPSIEGEVTREFELNGFTYKQIQATEGNRYTQNDVEISEDAFVSALQITIRQDEDARLAAEAEAARSQGDTPALAPVPPVVGGEAPTQEQIDADLKAAGV